MEAFAVALAGLRLIATLNGIPEADIVTPAQREIAEAIAESAHSLIPPVVIARNGTGSLVGPVPVDGGVVGISDDTGWWKVAEDSPLWDCETMGNKVCGPSGGPSGDVDINIGDACLDFGICLPNDETVDWSEVEHGEMDPIAVDEGRVRP